MCSSCIFCLVNLSSLDYPSFFLGFCPFNHQFFCFLLSHIVVERKMAQGCELKDVTKWENVDYKLQVEEVFAFIRKLGNKSLNPKTKITSTHVTKVDIIEVFGESKVLRTTNQNLDPNTKLELLHLYSQSYGHNNVTNNEFYLWFILKVTQLRRRVQK